jgi:uncharacterized protein (DUF2384 family)
MNPNDPEVAARVAAAHARAVEVLSSVERATQWLVSANPALSGARPTDLAAASVDGLDRVLTILGRVEHGIGF